MLEHKENKAQALAINHASGPMQVLAGPGSGKTYLIIRRICHLIRHHGISPGNILVITFTKAAAEEMKSRFYQLTQGCYPAVIFGTFHAVYYQILRQSGYGNLKIATRKEKQNYLKYILHTVNDAKEEEDSEIINKLLKEISITKNSKEIDSQKTFIPRFEEIYKEYNRIMKEEKKIDFDDMILLCDKLLEERKDICTYWRNAFTYILVDEFQDISPLQYQVLCRLSLPRNNLFVVGDDDQSIYGFRGAGPDIMKKFMKDFPMARQVVLDINYRCSDIIVKASEMVIKVNKNRYIKKITADRKNEGKVAIMPFDTKEEEYAYLITSLLKKTQKDRNETAVIFRTNAQTAAFSRQLAVKKIPFCMKEKPLSLFQAPEAADILSYLSFASDCFKNPAIGGKRSDFLRIMNKPLRYIKRDAVQEKVTKENLLRYYKDRPYMAEAVSRMFEEIKNIAVLRPYLAIDYIRKTISYEAYLYEGRTAEECNKCKEILNILQKSAGDFKTFEEWKSYIETYEEKMKKEQEGVHLLTMHGSKGLEYKSVYLASICDGFVPNKKAVLSNRIEEERRLLYVAMTRAKQFLEISYYGKPSPFLDALKKGW